MGGITMREFIIKYWIEFLFGIIVAMLSTAFAYYKKQYKKLKEVKEEEEKQKLIELVKQQIKSDEHKKIIESTVNERIIKVLESTNEENKTVKLQLAEIQRSLNIMRDSYTLFFYNQIAQAAINLLQKDFIYVDELQNFQKMYDAYEKIEDDGHLQELYDKVLNKKIKNRGED